MFDLSCEQLREIHPSHNDTTAYSELVAFFQKNGFIHHQGSVYTTNFKAQESDIYNIMNMLYRVFPWIYPCSTSIHLAGFESVVKADIKEYFGKMYAHDVQTVGCDIDYINMHSENYDSSREALDFVDKEEGRLGEIQQKSISEHIQIVDKKDQKKETIKRKLIF